MEDQQTVQDLDLEKKASLPRRKLYLVILSLCLVSFLAAFDNIIVASNTPLIAAASTSQPMYGKSVDMFGRRGCFLFATASYLVGSILCGAAQSMVMLIVARALCGLGIGAFDTLMKIVVADYIPVRYIGTYQSMLGISWGLGYVVGALVGYCILSLIFIFFAIEGPESEERKVAKKLGQIDFLGIILWVLATVSLVLALSWGGTSYAWNSAVIISLLCVSGVLLILFGLHERLWVKRDPIVPFEIFTSNRSTVLILVAAFCYGGCFQSLMTYVPLYLSVIRQEDALASNLELLCLVLLACIFNVITGLVIVKTGRYTWATRLSLSILVLACGLLQFLDVRSSRGLIVGLMIVTGIGSGGMINSEIITAQASVPVHHVPAIVAFMTFCDQVGGITGITAQGSILSNHLIQTLNDLNLPNVQPSLVRQSASYLWGLPEPARSIVTRVYLESIKMSFWGSFAFASAGLLATLGLKAYDEKYLIIDENDTKETIDLEFIYGVSVTDSELTLYALWKQPVIETGSTRPAETRWERKTMSYQVTDENQEWINKLRKLTLPEHQATRVIAFVNPSSGRRGADTAWKNVVRPMLLQAGFIDSHLTVVMTESGGKTTQQAQQIAHELTQDTVLVVMGGDGTVHEVLNGLLSQPLSSRPMRVGVVPVGSGNAFAMGLGIDGVEHAVLRIIKGHTQNCGWMNVRLGQSSIQGSGWENEINYRPDDMKLFIVMSWGFHAQIVSKSRYLKYFMGNRRFSLVAMALLTFLQQYEGELMLKDAVKYNKEHHQFDEQSETIVVNDKFTYFVISKQPSLEKGFTITPFASPLDDQMDVILLRNANANQLTEASMQAFQGGKHVNLDKVDYFKAKEVLLRVKDKTEICLDGEIHDLPSNGIVHLKGSNEPAFAVFV
ncbi:MFS general substrate transporter [Rhizopus microsporus var. microsporus]|uniref:MFS general substrate transporter n=1 Tax=Rhizopus microsporus var. microsporus TaxID=86635 RepID=A0A1X0R385_RHIZD|nr:MFS general substrate transporter [Rhizopus microsporus var. microsporus]